MIPPTPAERALYADLTAMMLQMKGEPLNRVETAIEERFQAFLCAQHPRRGAELQIIHTYTLHDDIEPWAEYRTEYRVATHDASPATPGQTQPRWLSQTATPPACGSNIIPFPRSRSVDEPELTTAADLARPGGA